MRGLPYIVKENLEKAVDSALLAVEIYNKPAIKFKSGGYITLMVIAWTSLFHAIYYKRKVKPIYKLKNGRFKRVNGELMFWELKKCAEEYFDNFSTNPVYNNLNFFIPLRNKIEHKSMPEIDPNIFAECQALLLNFDELIQNEFGEEYCLKESLSFSLQLFPNKGTLNSININNKSNKDVIDFITNYRTAIDANVQSDSKYAFKAYLIQVSNHNSQDAMPVQFIHYDKLEQNEKEELQKFVTMIKYKNIPTSNHNLLKPSDIVKLVQEGLGNKKINVINRLNGNVLKETDEFTIGTHTLCWKKYKIRPESNVESPEITNPKYCIYDSLNNNYGYTQKWADFLIEELKIDEKYNSLYSDRTRNTGANNVYSACGF